LAPETADLLFNQATNNQFQVDLNQVKVLQVHPNHKFTHHPQPLHNQLMVHGEFNQIKFQPATTQ